MYKNRGAANFYLLPPFSCRAACLPLLLLLIPDVPAGAQQTSQTPPLGPPATSSPCLAHAVVLPPALCMLGPMGHPMALLPAQVQPLSPSPGFHSTAVSPAAFSPRSV